MSKKSSLLFLLFAAITANSIVIAEQLPEPLRFVIEKFEVLGDNPLSIAETDDIFKDYLGEHSGLQGIQSAATVFEEKMRAKGFAFYRVNLAPQTLQNGIIKLQLIQLKVDNVEIEGNKHFSEANLRRNIPTLKTGEAANTRILSRAIDMADGQPSKSLKLQFSENETGGAINAKLKVTDMKTHFGFVSLNNTGNDETGDFRLTGGYQFSNLFDRDHNLSLSYTTSPDDFSAVQQYGASYTIPFYATGGEFSLFLARSDVDSGVVAQTFSVSGAGTIVLLHYKHTFLQKGAYKQQLDVGLDYKLFENDIGLAGLPGVQVTGTGDVLSRALSLAYTGFWQGTGKNLNFNIAVFKNISGGSDNTDSAYGQVRSGAKADWSLFRYGFGFSQLIKESWFFRLNLLGQQSSERLIAGEQFGIGGIYSVRGFDERALLGDSGIQANAELWLPSFSKYDIRPVVFFDYGHVELESALSNETSSIDISSIGAGLRWSIINKLNIVFDVAVVTGGAEETNISGSNDATESGDIKAHIDVFYRF